MKNIFTDHPKKMGETYFEHMKFACKFGFKLLIAGWACILHAIFPFIFKDTGSNMLFKMLHEFIERLPRIETRLERIHELITKKAVQEEIISK